VPFWEPMIPYYPPIQFHLGPLTVHGFALLVVTGVVLGAQLVFKRGAELGISRSELQSMMRWALGAGFVVSHCFEIVFYSWDRLMDQGPLLLLKIWDGMSSYGGFVGAIIGMWIFARFWGRRPLLFYCDLTIQGLVLGWIFGRLGCTIAHDHPGRLTDFPLAFAYPGGARHDLGFYEFLYTLLFLFPLALGLHRALRGKMNVPHGIYVAVMALAYAPVRFCLDFLRLDHDSGGDVRYLELTPSQYACIGALVFVGHFLWRHPGVGWSFLTVRIEQNAIHGSQGGTNRIHHDRP
jgi:phosphatidylglycerol:prolipoprotein diacylglycerol transferase